MNPTSTTERLPTAVPIGRGWWWWLVPAAALLIAVALGVQAWLDRGITVSITFTDGHGITVGDNVKYRGIVVGKVRRIRLSEDGGTIEVTAGLSRDAAILAREGSRFWLVRPEIGLSRIAGLETIVGARYIGVTPGERGLGERGPGAGRPQLRFQGLDDPPVIDRAEAGDLVIVVESTRRGSLAPGSPVVYRQVQVGSVVAVRLSEDAAMVEATVHVHRRYAPLVRAGTRFWDVGGIEIGVGFTGLRASFESTELLLRGGLEFATPPNAGAAAQPGDRFRLDSELRREWHDWRPDVRLEP